MNATLFHLIYVALFLLNLSMCFTLLISNALPLQCFAQPCLHTAVSWASLRTQRHWHTSHHQMFLLFVFHRLCAAWRLYAPCLNGGLWCSATVSRLLETSLRYSLMRTMYLTLNIREDLNCIVQSSRSRFRLQVWEQQLVYLGDWGAGQSSGRLRWWWWWCSSSPWRASFHWRSRTNDFP